MSVTKQEQLCPAHSMVEDIFWHEEPCREWAGHKQDKKMTPIYFKLRANPNLFHNAFFFSKDTSSNWKGIEMDTADILTKFIISTQRQAETEIYTIGLYDMEEKCNMR